jgi:hypothetical protein
MTDAPVYTQHARRRHNAATEAALWLVWVTARATGLAALGRGAARLTRTVVGGDTTHRVDAAVRELAAAAARAAARALIRVELAAADLLTGPAPYLLDTAAARLRRRAGWLALGTALVLQLLWLAVRP